VKITYKEKECEKKRGREKEKKRGNERKRKI